jgi:hypothetical protein
MCVDPVFSTTKGVLHLFGDKRDRANSSTRLMAREELLDNSVPLSDCGW